MPKADEEKDAVAIAVESDKAKGKDKKGKDEKGKKKKDEPEELSEEDQILKEKLETAVVRAQDKDVGQQKFGLENLSAEIQGSTSSMTAVPKPLKYLRPHYATLVEYFEKLDKSHTLYKEFADVVSVLAMTMAEPGSRYCLKSKLMGNRLDLAPWGAEYIRCLAGEIGQEYNDRTLAAAEGEDMEVEPDVSDLMALVDIIVPYHVEHNSEPEAVDILLEVQQLDKLVDPNLATIDDQNYQRVCLYLLTCSDYMSDPDDLMNLLVVSYKIYKRVGQLPDAMRVALKMQDMALVAEVFECCDDEIVKKQLALLLGRHKTNFEYEEDEDINELISNTQLSEQFLGLARELDVLEEKTPEDIYKSALSETNSLRNRRSDNTQQVDSARQNLASTFVNAFVNAGFGKDKLMTPEGAKWLYKNKEHGMMSAAASLGMILQWNVEEGLTQIDKFLYSTDDYIKAGAILAVGIISSGVRNECDPALALLSEHLVGESSHSRKCGASLGLGLAYAGSNREDVQEVLGPVIADTGDKANMTEVSLAALSLGLVYVGSCDEDVGAMLVSRLMEASEKELDDTMARFLCLGLGLLFLGKQEKADAMIEAIKTVEHKISKYAVLTLESCAYAGTGNVLKIQAMLHECAEHIDEEKDKNGAAHQSVACIGIALIATGETVGSQMALRTYDHLLQYGDKPIRMAIPLALALQHISLPDYSVIDILSRLSHDPDTEVAQCAILSMGLVGGGTNNSRIAGLLRQLADFYAREPNPLFVVRLAQGLLHAGKGLMTFHPFHSDRLLMSPVAMGGILTILHASLDMKPILLEKTHYLM
jgi:26S proteasome regulatory subunit N1